MDEKQDKKDETVETVETLEVVETVEVLEEASEDAAIDPNDPRRFNMVKPDQYNTWLPDFLADGFEQITLPLTPDDEGECVCTVTRYTPQNDPTLGEAPAPRFAFLYIHGWNDYFYHPHIAREVARVGGAFYALDLRKYGRSFRPWQTFGFTDNLTDYDEDIRLARRVIARTWGADFPLVLYGHSTGGLIAPLWAQRHPGTLAGLILNSPWLEFQSYTALRTLGAPVLATLGRLSPKQIIPLPDNGYYHRSITAWREGEEVYGQRSDMEIEAGVSHLEDDSADTATSQERPHHLWAPKNTSDPFWTSGWKPDPRFRAFPSWPVRAAWISAILAGHARVAEGLDIDCPILVLTSTASTQAGEWCEEYLRTDSVLNVEQIWKRIGSLGSHVCLVKLENALHDVLLSREEVREHAFAHIRDFLKRL